MSIPVSKPFIKRKDMDAVLTCLVEDHVGPGKETETLVQEVLDQCQCEAGYALRDPESAWRLLFQVLKGLGVGRVAVCVLAPLEIFTAAQNAGIELALVDSMPDLPVLDCNGLASLEQPIEALILNYNCGYVGDLDALVAWCRERQIMIIEDISHAFSYPLLVEGLNSEKSQETTDGLELVPERPEVRNWAGSTIYFPGQVGTFEIIHTEFDSLLTTGGGGLVLARTAEAAVALALQAESLAPSAFLGDMNAALGRTQLKSLSEMLGRRMELHGMFKAALLRGRHKMFHAAYGFFPHSLAVSVQSSVQEVQSFARKKGIDSNFAFSGCILQKTATHGSETAKTWPRAYGMMLRTLLFPLHCGLHHKEIELLLKVLPSLP